MTFVRKQYFIVMTYYDVATTKKPRKPSFLSDVSFVLQILNQQTIRLLWQQPEVSFTLLVRVKETKAPLIRCLVRGMQSLA